MDWHEALNAMQCGRAVRRVSQSVRLLIGKTPDGTSIYEDGHEPIELASACTAAMQHVDVFRGVWSSVLSQPSDEDMAAEDWIEVPR